MTDAMEIVDIMCERYSAAVSANDSVAYGSLFCNDAIRIPPGCEPEHGPKAIARGEQNDYDRATFTCTSRPIDALRIDDDHVYGIAEAEVTTVSHDDGATKSFKATKTWLLERRQTGDWSIKRQMWNLK